MEEKYSFTEKKLALEKYIQNQNKKNYDVRQIKNLKIKKESDVCIYCDNNTENKHLFCSNICEIIFYSNNTKIIPATFNQIKFVPFELLNKKSKQIYKEFVKEKHKYDKFQIYYSIVKADNQAVIQTTFKFIYDFEVIKIKKINFELNFLYVEEKQKLNYISLGEGMPDKFDNICLYCKCETSKYTIKIDKNYIIGHICSVFCYKTFMTYIENHINFPYKFFFSLPPISLFKNKDEILKNRHKNSNYENTVLETEYNENNNNTFSINIIRY